MSALDIIPRILVPFAVAVSFALLRKYLPAARSAELPRSLSIDDLNSRFRYAQWAVGFAMFFTAVTLAWITHKCLVSLSLFFAAAEGPASFQLLPSPAIWWFLPGLGAVALCWEITLYCWSLFGDGETIARYVTWSNVRTGFDSTKALRWTALVLVLPIAVLTLLAVPMHSTLHKDAIHVRHYASLSSLRYPYKDARRLAVVNGIRMRDGKFTPRAEVLIRFADGSRWSSADNRDYERDVDQDLVAFLAQETQLPVEYAETEADLTPSF